MFDGMVEYTSDVSEEFLSEHLMTFGFLRLG